MDQEDVTRFQKKLEKHLRGDFTEDERHQMEKMRARAKANVKRIISNCGGKNPILGY